MWLQFREMWARVSQPWHNWLVTVWGGGKFSVHYRMFTRIMAYTHGMIEASFPPAVATTVSSNTASVPWWVKFKNNWWDGTEQLVRSQQDGDWRETMERSLKVKVGKMSKKCCPIDFCRDRHVPWLIAQCGSHYPCCGYWVLEIWLAWHWGTI